MTLIINEKVDRVSTSMKSLVVILLICTLVASALQPTVNLDVGSIKGLRTSIGNAKCDAYLSVPFAEPPIGDNRFEKTVPVKSWNDLKDTTNAPLPCAPIDPRDPPFNRTSEDCLYLNVFTPPKESLNADELLPIVFIIHGGAFEVGNAWKGYTISSARAANLIRNKIIIVAIQYRLAQFGFASDGSSELPGNLGYWDQKEALEFISRNAASLGGDENRITVMGHSAGSASALALSISPHTRDMVQQIIGMSGSVYSAWATNSDIVLENTRLLVETIGRKEGESMKGCLKRATDEEIYAALDRIGTSKFGQSFGMFEPRLDNDFFPKDFSELISDTKPKPTLISCVSQESLTLVSSRNRSTSSFTLSDQQIENFSRNDIENLVRNYVITKEVYRDDANKVQNMVLDFYLNTSSKSPEKSFLLHQYTQIFSDLQFNVPGIIEIQERLTRKWPVFAQLNSYVSASCIPSRSPIVESYHGSDQSYLKCDSGLLLNDTSDLFMEQITNDYLVAFIKTGNPSTRDFEWKQTSNSNSIEYAELRPNDTRMLNGLFKDRFDFWMSINREYDYYDVIRMKRTKNNTTSKYSYYFDKITRLLISKSNENDLLAVMLVNDLNCSIPTHAMDPLLKVPGKKLLIVNHQTPYRYKRILSCCLIGIVILTTSTYVLNHFDHSNRTVGPSIKLDKPSPLKPWSGVKVAILQAPMCIQLDAPEIEGHSSEDCLYLNIFKPHNPSNDPLPILFAIHGGAFEFGNSGTFGLNGNRALKLLKKRSNCVYGFASDGSGELPGNLGYWDQKEALEFISRNAASFGGDPKRITIIGCSAGSASTTALSISPHTREMVGQVLGMSGSTFGAWALSEVVVENTNNLVKAMGQKPNESVKDRLKRASSKEIYSATMKIGTTHFSQNFGTFIPRLDGEFFPRDIPQLIRESPAKTVVLGLTSEESLPWTLIPLSNYTCSDLVIPLEKRANFSVNNLETLVRQHLVTEENFKDKTTEVQDKILRFYTKSNNYNKKNVFYLQRYTQIFSDLQFAIPILWDVLEREANGWKVFVYKSSYINNALIPSTCPVKKSWHGSDQQYNDVRDDEVDSPVDRQMEEIYGDWLVAFVTSGNPSIPGIKWQPTSSEYPLRYADFLPKPKMKDALFLDRVQFWINLTREYDYDLVRMMTKKQYKFLNLPSL
ncbi:Hydrolase [Aphelenchoides besseyi]|nr:Hydrolase [Aphelenchoides besseyi]